MKLPIFFLIIWGFAYTSSTYGGETIARSEILDAAVVFGVPGDERSLSVFLLSCEKCQERLRSVRRGESLGERFFLVAEGLKERRVSQLLLACWLNKGRNEDQFGEVLELFLESPDEYLRDPESLEGLVVGFIGGLDDSVLAEAIDLLDSQVSLLSILGINRYPTELSLGTEQISLRKSGDLESSLSRLRDSSASVSYLYPKFGETGKGRVARIALNPMYPLNFDAWETLSRNRKGSFSWYWVASEEELAGSRFLSWQCSLAKKPTDLARRMAFESFLERVGNLDLSGEYSTEQLLERLGLGDHASSRDIEKRVKVRLKQMQLAESLSSGRS